MPRRMIPVTAEEYNTLIDTTQDPTVDSIIRLNISIAIESWKILKQIKDQLEDNTLTDSQKESLNQALIRGEQSFKKYRRWIQIR